MIHSTLSEKTNVRKLAVESDQLGYVDSRSREEEDDDDGRTIFLRMIFCIFETANVCEQRGSWAVYTRKHCSHIP